MKNSPIKRGLLLVCMLFVFGSGQQLYAQFPGGPSFDDDVEDVPEAPINGLIGIALAVGAYFGAKKVKQSKP